MNNSISIGKIFNIEIRIHYSWFLIFILVALSLIQYSHSIFWGLITTLLIFGGVLTHELSHSLVGKKNKIEIKSITLFIFGGVASIAEEPSQPNIEFKMAIAGPLTSFSLALISFILSLIFSRVNFLLEMFKYLFYINLVLAVFNLIPAFPLDGGRILRSILWRKTKSLSRATKISLKVSKIIVWGFIFWGILNIFWGNLFNGLWIILIAWFLLQAAELSYQRVLIADAFINIPVTEAMDKNVICIYPHTLLRDLVNQYFLRFYQGGFSVTDQEGKFLGLITLSDIQKVPKEKWALTTVGEVMTPRERIIFVTPRESVYDALNKMLANDLFQIPVLEEEKLLGVVNRNIISFLLTLKMPWESFK